MRPRLPILLCGPDKPHLDRLCMVIDLSSRFRAYTCDTLPADVMPVAVIVCDMDATSVRLVVSAYPMAPVIALANADHAAYLESGACAVVLPADVRLLRERLGQLTARKRGPKPNPLWHHDRHRKPLAEACRG